jgi:hypothetical protein
MLTPYSATSRRLVQARALAFLCHAIRRIGEISKSLEKAEQSKGARHPIGGMSVRRKRTSSFMRLKRWKSCPIGNVLPSRESHVRELLTLESDEGRARKQGMH